MTMPMYFRNILAPVKCGSRVRMGFEWEYLDANWWQRIPLQRRVANGTADRLFDEWVTTFKGVYRPFGWPHIAQDRSTDI